MDALNLLHRMRINYIFGRASGTMGALTLDWVVQSPIRALYSQLMFHDNTFHTLQSNHERIAYINEHAREHGIREADNDVVGRFSAYRQWFLLMRGELIWSSDANEVNATSFLSSPFFDVLVYDASPVWVGQRP